MRSLHSSRVGSHLRKELQSDELTFANDDRAERARIVAREIDIFNGDNKTAAYRRINPLGKAPALKLEDETILTESNAILSYLANGTEYFPSDALLRARVLQWMFFEQYIHLLYIGVARFYLHLLKKPPPHDDDLATWHWRGNLALQIMDRHLADTRWFAADAFTIRRHRSLRIHPCRSRRRF